MLRGRQRGLPVTIDRAVMLPGFKLDDEMTLQRRMSLNMNHTPADWPHTGGDGPARRSTIETMSMREGA